jgi:hypothetical protein
MVVPLVWIAEISGFAEEKRSFSAIAEERSVRTKPAGQSI